MIKITQSNNQAYIDQDLKFNASKDLLIIDTSGLSLLGTMGLGAKKKYEIKADEVKEFKIIDEKSNTIKKKAAGGTIGGAVVGGLLTGGVGAIVGAMLGGNKKIKDAKIDLGFKLKNGDWFVATFKTDDAESFTSSMYKIALEAIIKRFAKVTEAPF